MNRHRIARLTAPIVAARLTAGAAVLMPMGSTETHGPALPMGDYLIAEMIADRIAEASIEAGDDALIAPPIPYGGEDFFAGVQGGVSLTNDVLQAIVEQTAEAFIRTGTRRILIVNGHGGSIAAVDAAARAMRARHGVIIATLHLWKVAGPWQQQLGGAADALGHGGDPIASVAMHLLPTLCAPGKAQARAPAMPFLGLPVTGFGTVACEGVEFAVPITVAEIADGGVQAADARSANPAHGARIVERFATAGAAMLAALARTP